MEVWSGSLTPRLGCQTLPGTSILYDLCIAMRISFGPKICQVCSSYLEISVRCHVLPVKWLHQKCRVCISWYLIPSVMLFKILDMLLCMPRTTPEHYWDWTVGNCSQDMGAARVSHSPAFLSFFPFFKKKKKCGVTCFLVFCGFVWISLSGSLSSSLQRTLFVFIGKRLTCGFLFSASVGFCAFSFLTVALHVSCSIFNIFALRWMTRKYVCRTASLCKRIGNNKRWARCRIDWLNGIRPSWSSVTLFWIPENFKCSSCSTYRPFSVVVEEGLRQTNPFLPCKEGVKLDNPESLVFKAPLPGHISSGFNYTIIRFLTCSIFEQRPFHAAMNTLL